jgi:para-aminobenzoate synthetase component 1
VPDLGWRGIIGQVVAKNGLGGQVAAVKILATRGSRSTPPWDHQIVVSARPYTHRMAGKEAPGLQLATYPESRQTPLADHKTTNYLFCHLAGEWARGMGADEALILNPDGSVSETNSANILLIRDRMVKAPASAHVLPGVMQGAVCSVLTELGYTLESLNLMPDAFFDADMVLCTNALMGAVPVVRLDGRDVRYCTELCDRVNARVL